jgi:trigger factor
VSETDAVVVDETSDETDVTEAPSERKMTLHVEIESAGPCRKRIQVVVPEADVSYIRDQTLDEFAGKASVPGFRPGRVPRKLVEAKFGRELADELKQRMLVQSLEQLTVEHKLDPIDEPDMDVEAIEVPDEGDFEYAFEVEVRPDIDLPEFDSITLKREVREVSDEDVQKYLDRMLLEYGEKTTHDGAASPGDYLTVSIEFEQGGQTAREVSELSLRIQPTLRFSDAELAGFDTLMDGVSAGESREAEMTISKEASHIPMRGEKLKAVFNVAEVHRFHPAELGASLLDRIGVESEEKMRDEIRTILERQVTYRQRQSARQQLLELITASSEWELPEELVMKQVDNALHREILEMQQAGYTPPEIRARENELRQQSVSTTRTAMKEHFVLDRIATTEGIEVGEADIEMEIMMMAFQSGETPRRLRARLVKSGVIENLEAQIRERKAVDVALEKAAYDEVPMEEELVGDLDVEAVDDAVCNIMFARSSTPAVAGSAD